MSIDLPIEAIARIAQTMTPSEPETCVCTALRQAARRVSQHYDAALSTTGISTNQYAILRRLERFGPSTIQALAARLVMDRSTLGHLLRPLEARGFVDLATVATDRRRRDIALTPAGAALLGAAQPLWQAAQTAFEASYGAEEARRLRADLRRVSTTHPDGEASAGIGMADVGRRSGRPAPGHGEETRTCARGSTTAGPSRPSPS